MDCKYFILSKRADTSISSDESNCVVALEWNAITLLLPRINMPYYISNGLFEKDLIEWSKQLCSTEKVFLDIGAHTGSYSLCLAPYSRNVVSFEPQRSTFYALCGSVALSGVNNIECINIGLGNASQAGDCDLRIRSMDGGGSSIHNIAGSTVLRTEKIEVRTLDSFELSDIGFIKMDVEFNERQVLEGALETIRRSNYPKILLESNDDDSRLFMYIRDIMGYRNILKVRGTDNMYLCENGA
jgi:FkbM family methyltransferase